jgi:hypothetical protein
LPAFTSEVELPALVEASLRAGDGCAEVLLAGVPLSAVAELLESLAGLPYALEPVCPDELLD